MMKAAILLIGVSIYVWFLQQGKLVAERELGHVQNLYTSAATQATAISSSQP